jgi:hypothetical protein
VASCSVGAVSMGGAPVTVCSSEPLVYRLAVLKAIQWNQRASVVLFSCAAGSSANQRGEHRQQAVSLQEMLLIELHTQHNSGCALFGADAAQGSQPKAPRLTVTGPLYGSALGDTVSPPRATGLSSFNTLMV